MRDPIPSLSLDSTSAFPFFFPMTAVLLASLQVQPGELIYFRMIIVAIITSFTFFCRFYNPEQNLLNNVPWHVNVVV